MHPSPQLVDEFADAVARVRVATFADDHDDVEGLREAVLAWGPDALKVADAAVALDRGDPLAALELLDAATVMQAPARAVANRLRAEAHLDAGRPQDAIVALAGLVGDEALVTRAKALFRLRRPEEAEALLDDVLGRDPENWEARYGRAAVWLSTQRLREAVDLLGALQAEHPLDPRPYRALAKVFLLTGAPEKGIPFLERLLDHRLLASPAVAIDLAELYAAVGERERLPVVLEAVTRAARVGPGQAVALASLWQEVPSSGAIRHLADAFADHPVAPLLEGLALEVDGRDAEALAAFSHAAELEHWLVHERLAAHLLAAEERERALHHLAIAERMAPRTPAVRLTRAVADLATDPDAAVAALRYAADMPAFRATVRLRARRALDAIGA